MDPKNSPFTQPPMGAPTEPPTNQVCMVVVDPDDYAGTIRGNKRPDAETFARHSDHFDRLTQGQSFQPPKQAKLPADWEYKTTATPGFHSSASVGFVIWAITNEGRYVGALDVLLDELAAVRKPGKSDLIRRALRHSHWEGIRGGARSLVVVENTLASGFPAVAVDAEELRQILGLEPSDDARKDYFAALFDKLSILT